VPAFTQDQWLVVALVFVLGMVIGMALLSGGKWKRRYREEQALRKDEAKAADERAAILDTENKRLRTENAELTTLRGAAIKSERAQTNRGADAVPPPLEGDPDHLTGERTDHRLAGERLERDKLQSEYEEAERRAEDRRTGERRLGDRRTDNDGNPVT